MPSSLTDTGRENRATPRVCRNLRPKARGRAHIGRSASEFDGTKRGPIEGRPRAAEEATCRCDGLSRRSWSPGIRPGDRRGGRGHDPDGPRRRTVALAEPERAARPRLEDGRTRYGARRPACTAAQDGRACRRRAVGERTRHARENGPRQHRSRTGRRRRDRSGYATEDGCAGRIGNAGRRAGAALSDEHAAVPTPLREVVTRVSWLCYRFSDRSRHRDPRRFARTLDRTSRPE